MLEEKENLLLLLAKREDESSEPKLSNFHQERLANTRKHIDRLRSFLSYLNEDLHNSHIPREQ
jgi:hypothetical protein